VLSLAVPPLCSLYLDRLELTVGMRQVASRIAAFREEVERRVPRAFPH
jgi:hypothetical protein